MKRSFNKVAYLFPLACSVLFFLASKGLVPRLVYLLLGLALGLYFFPIKLIWRNTKVVDKQNIISAFSLFVLSAIAGLSVVIIFSRTTDLLTAFKILALLNFILLSYFYLKGFERSVVLTHLGFTVLTAAVIGI